jgi:hypothetical protein
VHLRRKDSEESDESDEAEDKIPLLHARRTPRHRRLLRNLFFMRAIQTRPITPYTAPMHRHTRHMFGTVVTIIALVVGVVAVESHMFVSQVNASVSGVKAK